jgi:DNA-binding NarL/FixJ family response regulator
MARVADGTNTVASDRARAGWAALSEGRWEAARAAFDASLQEEKTAEALEGQSWSAWWLDDADGVFAAREGAYRLYRDRDDLADAARMATWLAADQLDFRGAGAVAAGWLRRAHRLLDPLEPEPAHGWLAFHEGFIAHVGGDTARAAELGAEAAGLGRRFDVPDLEMLGLALEGAARVARAEVADGMALLDEATAAALERTATIPISSAWACCFLVSACTATLDFERAFAWCDRIAEFAERYDSRYMLGFCRAEYGTVHLWRGRWDEAERFLTGSIDAYARSRPAMAGGPTVALAELRRRQGRSGEALELLGERSSGAAALCRARLALDGGDCRHAAEITDQVLRRSPPGTVVARAPALALLVHARVACEETDAAAAAAEELRELATVVGTAPLRAGADLADATILALRGEHERALPLLADAADGYRETGAPYEEALARAELAATLEALGRASAAPQAAKAADVLDALGAEADARRVRSRFAGSVRSPVTPREREVLALLAEGLTNGQIAARLTVSEHTVHRHVTNILRKLGLPSRAAAAAYAARSGLLGP